MALYHADFESTISYILKKDFTTVEKIEGEKLEILKKLLSHLLDTYEGRPEVTTSLEKVQNFVIHETCLETEKFNDFLKSNLVAVRLEVILLYIYLAPSGLFLTPGRIK